MKIEHAAALPTLCFVTHTSLNGLGVYVRNIAHDLYKVAADTGLEVAGPVYWIYNGADGQPDTEFELTIALPITAPDETWQSERFEIKTLPAFHYHAQRLQGPWQLLGQTYGAILAEIKNEGLQLSGENRELYLRMDFLNPDNNVTEVQLGLIP